MKRQILNLEVECDQEVASTLLQELKCVLEEVACKTKTTVQLTEKLEE